MRLRSVIVAVVAVLAFGAIAATSASAALPEFIPTGGAFPVGFTSTSLTGQEQILETTGGATVKCKKATTAGEFTSNGHLGSIHILFKECSTVVIFEGPCGNPTASTKEILVQGLFHIGYTNVSKKEVGVLINSDTSPLAKFECEVLGIKETVNVTGEVVGAMTGTFNTPRQTELTVSFSQTKGKQALQQITLPLVSETELMPAVHLTSERGSSKEEAGQHSEANHLVLSGGETGELKA